MKHYITPEFEHYCAEQAMSIYDVEVPPRPSPYHVYKNGQWVEDPDKAAEAAEQESMRQALNPVALFKTLKDIQDRLIQLENKP